MRNWFVAFTLALGMWNSFAIAEGSVDHQIDWPAYLATQDPQWDTLPQSWHESVFVGNGLMGSMMFQSSPNSMTIQIGRGDVNDHRLASGKAAMNNVLPDSSRLPIGFFTLTTDSPITGCDLRVDLYNAEFRGTLQTENGDIAVRAFMHSEEMLLVFEADGGNDAAVDLTWTAEEAFCPRVKGRRDRGDEKYREGYLLNPAPVLGKAGDIHTCRQDLLADGQTGTAWIVEKDGTKQTLLASVGHTFPESTALDDAITVVEQARQKSAAELEASHRVWWHNFYPRSFVSLPDQRLSSFYWLQNYKMAAATKGGHAIADNQGPWLQPTGWPGTWWNLNVQLAYSHLPTAGYHDLAQGLTDHLYKYRDNLRNNVPDWMDDAMGINTVSGFDLLSPMKDPTKNKNTATGNLLWAVHNTYMGYRHTMDDELLEQKILPLLKPSLNFYFYFMVEGDDGKIHLPNTNSPEYAGAENCNYDLALLRWGCQAFIDSHARLGTDDPMIAKCQDVLDRLVDYPVDETGFMLGKDFPFAKSHRHYSHLLMIYPLYLVTADDPANVELIKKSIDHWQSFPKALAGYSFTGSASMYASIGLGDIAEQRMQAFMDDKVLPNSFYAEGSPVIETPLAGARSLQDMLLQSWGAPGSNVIRVFPAVPAKWENVSFAKLSAEGAFDVSAVYADGKTQFVQVTSRAGEPCVVSADLGESFEVFGIPAEKVTSAGDAVFEIDLAKGESVVLARPSADLTIAPVEPANYGDWLWGLHTQGQTAAKKK